MKKVTFFELSSGKITRKAVLEDDMIVANLSDGEGWIEGHFDSETKMIFEGFVVDIPPEEIESYEIESAWKNLRETRNSILFGTDWTQAPDAPVDRAAWAAYRQELRDLPENTTDPRNVVWPTLPA